MIHLYCINCLIYRKLLKKKEIIIIYIIYIKKKFTKKIFLSNNKENI